jgi:hypothetical protein
MTFLTVAERKRRSAERLAAAADAVIRELADYARKTGGPGRFIVFGSAPSGEMRYDSDFDVIVDFPAAEEAAASVGVEIVAGEASCLIKLHGSGEMLCRLEGVFEDIRPARVAQGKIRTGAFITRSMKPPSNIEAGSTSGLMPWRPQDFSTALSLTRPAGSAIWQRAVTEPSTLRRQVRR